MRTLIERARPDRPARRRIILLPAAFSEPEAFVQAGFVAAVRARALDLDLLLAAPELAHVSDRTVLAQIETELVAPARAEGIAVWLGGISLGGFIALACAARTPRAYAGLCLLAPYLGSHLITDEVGTFGLAAWEPGADSGDEERHIWRFLKHRSPAELPIHLGLGREDRFAARHRVLAAALSAQEVDTVAGGHDWPTWHRLWENFLDAHFPVGS
ncbi:MAG: hypothetical protein JO341_08460 [Gammaproteobacteria bacterium]|nr:hypothetical protein [Gammaproteobacteria bacterium]